jgi:DNA polymerase-3 subunit epsilon
MLDRRKHGQGTYGHLFEPYTGEELVALDLETTGLNPRTAQILTIGAVIIRGHRVMSSKKLELKLQAPDELPIESVKVHKLRKIDLNEGKPVADTLHQLLEFIDNRPLVGYYLRFDISLLNRHLRDLMGFELPNRAIDVATLYRQQMKSHILDDCQINLGFESMSEHLGIPVIDRHTALGDAITAALIYLHLQCSDSALA